MDIRRRTLTAILLALLGTLCLGGTPVLAGEAGGASIRSQSPCDIFSDELKKRQATEDHVAVCDASAPSVPAAKNVRSSRSSRAGQDDLARDAGTELVFLGLAELRRDFLPPADAIVPATPALALPPARSPPLR